MVRRLAPLRLQLLAACAACAAAGLRHPFAAPPSGPSPPTPPPLPLGHSRAARHLIAGAAAGAISNTVVAPLDILRLNLIVSSDGRGVFRMAKDIYARGGLAAFWYGNSADVIRTVPSSAIRFYTFALYKGQLAGLAFLPPAAVSLLAGGFAGMTAMAACFPLETVRTRMATLGAAQGVRLVDYTRQLVATDGVGALYRGLTPSLISVMPYFAVRFGCYDILQRWYAAVVDSSGATAAASGGNGERSKAQTRSDSTRARVRAGLERGRGLSPSATFGMVAGMCASTTTFPFELVRRRAMVGHSETNPITAMLRIYREEGLRRGLYKGFGLSLIKVAPSSAVTFLAYEMCFSALTKIVEDRAASQAKRELAIVERQEPADTATD